MKLNKHHRVQNVNFHVLPVLSVRFRFQLFYVFLYVETLLNWFCAKFVSSRFTKRLDKYCMEPCDVIWATVVQGAPTHRVTRCALSAPNGEPCLTMDASSRSHRGPPPSLKIQFARVKLCQDRNTFCLMCVKFHKDTRPIGGVMSAVTPKVVCALSDSALQMDLLKHTDWRSDLTPYKN